jgi:LysM repeat protein
MFHKLLQAFDSTTQGALKIWRRGSMPRRILLILITTLLAGFVLSSSYPQKVHAARQKTEAHCVQYTVRRGDTLSAIAEKGHIDVLTLARANGIANRNIIFAAHVLCLPPPTRVAVEQKSGEYVTSIVARGNVRWYAYDALERSTYQQVDALLRRAAAYYGLPVNLVLAIARQESGLRQHVIASDGGIGVMQVMPYTALAINRMTGIVRNPYKVQDNIFLGAFYLRMLGDSFHGNMSEIISAYNEGPWAVAHQGIFNWHYVDSVMAML